MFRKRRSFTTKKMLSLGSIYQLANNPNYQENSTLSAAKSFTIQGLYKEEAKISPTPT